MRTGLCGPDCAGVGKAEAAFFLFPRLTAKDGESRAVTGINRKGALARNKRNMRFFWKRVSAGASKAGPRRTQTQWVLREEGAAARSCAQGTQRGKRRGLRTGRRYSICWLGGRP
ncbi:hypothetical protein A5N82_04945 [Christensenella minuta]|nr:hypothetical protein B1H56_11935 [Christensenella minuta]OAQ40042.1 hypothetical protein A5N82_04945 [Christensenella minuta]